MSSPRAITQPLPTDVPSTGGDEFDDLFDYDFGGDDDPFTKPFVTPAPRQNMSSKKGSGGDGLGLDEEVEITRKPRIPRVKLDENRLLSAAGIPKLRKRAREHLKFKGKGHEYSDAAKLLAFYQLWLDDLFPKARFLDALAMVEKMGHKKRMQAMRMEWINEGRPRSSVHEESVFDEPGPPPRENIDTAEPVTRIAPIFKAKESERPKTPEIDFRMDDIYDATPKPVQRTPVEADSQPDSIFGGGNTSIFGPARIVDDAPPEDELDALLAEEEMMQTSSENAKPVLTDDGPPDDDLDALLAASGTATSVLTGAGAAISNEEDFDDEMDAMAEMEGMWS